MRNTIIVCLFVLGQFGCGATVVFVPEGDTPSAEEAYEAPALVVVPGEQPSEQAEPCTAEIEPAPEFIGYSEQDPLVPGAENELIAFFGIHPTCTVYVANAVLFDRVGGGDTAADFFNHLILLDVGATVSELYDWPQASYMFTPYDNLHFWGGISTGMSIVASVNAEPTGDRANVNGMVPFLVQFELVDATTSEHFFVESSLLQPVWIK